MQKKLYNLIIPFPRSLFKNDYSLFTKDNLSGFLIRFVYVDYLLLMGMNETEILALKRSFDLTFTIKDLGEACFFFSQEICRISHGILVNQCKYILDILFYVGMIG